MRVEKFDFDLPQDLIALRPAAPRDSAKMLVVKHDCPLQDSNCHALADWLEPGDALVFNDTKVIPAQLEGVRNREASTAKISATLHMRTGENEWLAFVKGAKKLNLGDNVDFGGSLQASVIEKSDDGEIGFRFTQSGNDLDEALVAFGHVPLPPYIAAKRATDDRDVTDYQTIYAQKRGAVAAPTAGLHFTDNLHDSLAKRDISQHFVTLHVGAGTFLPVKVDDTADHKMHSEWGEINAETAQNLNQVRARGNKIVSVGTTSLRLLESAASQTGEIHPFKASTDIFITPGYRFRAVDALMTNFHLPKSTLYMLVSAFAGVETMRDAYQHAIRSRYRFYSYGDSSLLFKKP